MKVSLKAKSLLCISVLGWAVEICAGADIEQVIYTDAIAITSNTGTIAVTSGVTYSVKMEILRNGLGGADERVSGVTFDGQSIGACNPDGGDYDCTFYDCDSTLTERKFTATSNTINVDLTFVGHSKHCECDTNSWTCSQEDAGRTPVSAVARFTLSPLCEHHDGLTGPFLGLKLSDGTDASSTWYAPYQNHQLASNLLGIEHPAGSGKYVDCNPASCDNPAVCGIPVCRGIRRGGVGGGVAGAYWTAAVRSHCGGTCNVQKYSQIVKSNFPSADNVRDVIDIHLGRDTAKSSAMKAAEFFPFQFLPGIRFGTYQTGTYTLGVVLTVPRVTSSTSGTGYSDGSWISPDRRYCNPLQMKSLAKMGFSHTGVSASSGVQKSSSVVFVKHSFCIKANCGTDATCHPIKCYVHKMGKCVQFNTNVMPDYLSSQTRDHSIAASEQFEAGNYGECTEDAYLASQSIIAGN